MTKSYSLQIIVKEKKVGEIVVSSSKKSTLCQLHLAVCQPNPQFISIAVLLYSRQKINPFHKIWQPNKEGWIPCLNLVHTFSFICLL